MSSLLNTLKLTNRQRSLRYKSPKEIGGTIYVVRLMAATKDLPSHQKYWLGCSKPCKNCESYLAKYGIRKIIYTDIQEGINVLVEMRLR